MKKLSKRQRFILDELKKPGVRVLYLDGINAYWFLTSDYKTYSKTIHTLFDLGILKRIENGRNIEAIINEQYNN